MSEAFYNSLAATALRLITDKGQPITLERQGEPVYDPETGQNEPTVDTYTMQAVVLPASGGTLQAFDIRIESGTLIETNIRALLIAAEGLDVTPKPGDKVTGFEGSEWTILGNTPLNPSGIPMIYRATVKR